jgi:hypothetical protein
MSGHLPVPTALPSKKVFSVPWGLFRNADSTWTFRRPQTFISYTENRRSWLGHSDASLVTIRSELSQLLNAPASTEYEASVDGVL